MKNLVRFNGRAAWKPSRILVLKTDACPNGWGFQVGSGDLRGGESWHPVLDQRLLTCHVVFLETSAVLRSMIAVKEVVRGRTVEVKVDNKWTKAYLENGGGRREDLTKIVEEIWTFCVDHDINLLQTSWIPGAENSVADEESRRVDTGDWELKSEVFKALDERWGPHTVDRMASAANAQVRRFNS